MKRSNVAWAAIYLVLSLLTLLGIGGCGGSSSNEPVSVPKLMGGAVQGKALTLFGTSSTLAGFPAAYPAQFGVGDAIVTDGTYVYIPAYMAVQKVAIATGEVTTLAGRTDGTGVLGDNYDGVGAAASFWGVRAMTTDGTDLYIVDGCAVRKIVKATGAVTTLAGGGNDVGSTDGVGLDARFRFPSDITCDGTNLYVADHGTIRKVVIATGAVTTIAGSPGETGSVDGTGSEARLSAWGITFLGGNLYVSENNHRIRKVDLFTAAVTTIADASDDTFFGLTNDGSNLYVAGWKSIYKVNPSTGDVTPWAGTLLAPPALGDGIGTAARFSWPHGITSDGTSLYVADTGTRSLRKVDVATATVTTVAKGESSIGSADGPAASARFQAPMDVTTDGTNLYVADSANNTIRKVVIATGKVSTVAGSSYAAINATADGEGETARFSFPSAITYDGKNLYVIDNGGTIRKVTPDKGVVTTLKTGLAAAGITTDGTYLYFSVPFEHAVRKLEIATGVVSILAQDSGAGALLGSPGSITTDGSNVYVADRDSGSINQIALATGKVSVLVSNGMMSQAYTGLTTDGTYLYASRGRIAKVAIATGAVTYVTNDAPGALGITTDGSRLYCVTSSNTIAVIR